jgi:hypothetical protein
MVDQQGLHPRTVVVAAALVKLAVILTAELAGLVAMD